MTKDSCPGQIYIVNVDTVNSGIQYAESFYVTSNFCLSRIDDRQSNLTVVSNIKYKKAVWGLVKSKFLKILELQYLFSFPMPRFTLGIVYGAI